MNLNHQNPALILGRFETALGVVWSLRKYLQGNIYTLDNKKDITYYSRFSKSLFCPNPIENEEKYLDRLFTISKEFEQKPVLFITSDNHLKIVNCNQELLSDYYHFNMASSELLNVIGDKSKLSQLALKNNIAVPLTYTIECKSDLDTILVKDIIFPLFLKGLDVNSWRQKVHGSKKGYIINSKEELNKRGEAILKLNVPYVLQEVIQGPDTNHYKVCVLYSKNGKQLLNFTLQKIRQNPIHFGVGAVVESIYYPELSDLGTKLFDSINFRGIGSAEFKLDEKDGKLKLIEINTRYWQQNYLATVCGMNFPLIDYFEATDQNYSSVSEFQYGIKWINRFMDFDSFLAYKKEDELTFSSWLKTLKGKKISSNFRLIDPLPALANINFGMKIINLPKFLLKKRI
ncbi:hypothetical protein C4577_00845 [Candidatus Parcubacteria bacterium]|nr:MAG: hypothetical protein C4577_00845 [Candidatus Parcubacteria bacterium]